MTASFKCGSWFVALMLATVCMLAACVFGLVKGEFFDASIDAGMVLLGIYLTIDAARDFVMAVVREHSVACD